MPTIGDKFYEVFPPKGNEKKWCVKWIKSGRDKPKISRFVRNNDAISPSAEEAKFATKEHATFYVGMVRLCDKRLTCLD